MEMSCVFHCGRYLFTELVREMRREKLIRREYAELMPMTVCTCRKKATYRQPITVEQVQDAADHVTDSTNPLHTKLSDRTCALVMSAARTACLSNVTAHDPTLTSQARLIVVISQVLRGDVILIREEGDQLKKKKNSEKTKPRKLKQEVVRIIINRKKRKLPLKGCTLNIPLFGGLSGSLFLNPQVGACFSRICSKYGCVLEFDSAATKVNMAAGKAVSVLKMWSPSRQTVADVVQLLESIALTIQKSSNWRRGITSRRQEPDLTYYPTGDCTAADSPQEYKHFLFCDYEKRRHMENKKGSKAPTFAPKNDGSSVIQGQCLNCHLQYMTFKLKSEQGNDVKDCRYHPGYVKENKWTCCKKQARSPHPIYEDHAQSGCVVDCHCWRAHKKVSRGAGTKGGCCSDKKQHGLA